MGQSMLLTLLNLWEPCTCIPDRRQSPPETKQTKQDSLVGSMLDLNLAASSSMLTFLLLFSAAGHGVATLLSINHTTSSSGDSSLSFMMTSFDCLSGPSY